jgi:hypothetical protein
MDSNQGRRLMTLLTVDAFLDAHREQLPKATAAGIRQRFGEALAEVTQHVQTQHASPLMAQGLTRTVREKRDALLRDHMAPITGIARLSAAEVPELKPIKMPRGGPGVQKLLAEADGMAVIAQQHRELFVAAGLPSTFVEDLRAAVEDIRTTLADRTNRYGDQAGAGKGLENGLVLGNKYKAVLDSLVRSEAHGNAELLADWDIIKRVPHAPGRRRGKTAPAPEATKTESSASPVAPVAPISDASRLLSNGSTGQVGGSILQEVTSVA